MNLLIIWPNIHAMRQPVNLFTYWIHWSPTPTHVISYSNTYSSTYSSIYKNNAGKNIMYQYIHLHVPHTQVKTVKTYVLMTSVVPILHLPMKYMWTLRIK